MLELKSHFTEEETERYISIIKELGYLDEVTFISFYYENLEKIRKLVPDQSAQFLFSEFTDEIIADVIRDGFDVDVYYKALNEEIIERLHSAGIKINCWTVDDKETAEKLAKWGVDFITTNILE